MTVFERFTDRARHVVELAQEEARGLRHGWIGTEHLLLGVLGEERGVGRRVLDGLGVTAEDARAWIRQEVGEGLDPVEPSDGDALRSIGIDVAEVRRAVEDAFGPGALERATARRRRRGGRSLRGGRCSTRSDLTGRIPFSPRSKKVLELSLREAVRLGHGYIGTEHILLGLVREGDGLAAMFLHRRGISADRVRAAVGDELRRGRTA
jgi:ATP-dependent Clp protease ATP-binding subunit ClpA